MHLYYLSEQEFKPLAAAVDETCWAQLMYFALMKDTTQQEIDELFRALSYARQDADAVNIAFQIRKAKMKMPQEDSDSEISWRPTIKTLQNHPFRPNITGFDSADIEGRSLDATGGGLTGEVTAEEEAEKGSFLQKLQASRVFRQKIDASTFFSEERKFDKDSKRAKGYLMEKTIRETILEQGLALKRSLSHPDHAPGAGAWWGGVLRRLSTVVKNEELHGILDEEELEEYPSPMTEGAENRLNVTI